MVVTGLGNYLKIIKIFKHKFIVVFYVIMHLFIKVETRLQS